MGSYEYGYAYDANGRRVQQVNSSGALDSFYDHTGALIYQKARDGTTHDYLYLQGRLVAIRDYDVNGAATAMRYQHTDALGSIIRQTDRTGAEIVGNVYDPWGKLLAGATPDSPGYTGHVMDASTNLIYMQQRYYDPDAMRFLSMDPVDASTINGSNLDRYWYASDNPYRYTDPDGRFVCAEEGDCPQVTSTMNNAISQITKAAADLNNSAKLSNHIAAAKLTKLVKFLKGENVKVGLGKSAGGEPGFASPTDKGKQASMIIDTARISTDAQKYGFNVNVETAAVIAHEGQHAEDNFEGGKGANTWPGYYGREFSAYQTQSYVNQGLNSNSMWEVWGRGWSSKMIHHGIDTEATQSADDDCSHSDGCVEPFQW